jgi:hypothetical protein
MQMTDAEIVRSYKQADPKKKVEQIRILSELNACDKKTIREILEKNGCNPPKYGNRYTGKVKKDGELKVEQTEIKVETPDIVVELVREAIMEYNAKIITMSAEIEKLSGQMLAITEERNKLSNWLLLMEHIKGIEGSTEE